LKRVTTRSPAFHFETLGPTATISPAPSEPATMGRLRGKMYLPLGRGKVLVMVGTGRGWGERVYLGDQEVTVVQGGAV
jgi:hypothetical protein